MATGRRAPLRCALMTGSCFSQRYVGDDWSEIGLITAFLGRSPRAWRKVRPPFFVTERETDLPFLRPRRQLRVVGGARLDAAVR